MASNNENNNIYPVNGRRLTSADLIPIFGSFINDDDKNQENLVYAIDIDVSKRDIKFVSVNSQDNDTIFAYNIDPDPNDSESIFKDERGGAGTIDYAEQTEDELNGYCYNGWNALKSTGTGKINMYTGGDRRVLLFPKLEVNTGSTPKYGRRDLRKDYEDYTDGQGVHTGKLTLLKNFIDTKINEDTGISDNTIDIIVNEISTKILDNQLIGTNAEKYHNNEKFLADLKNTFRYIKFDDKISNKIKAFQDYIQNIYDSLIDDRLTPINAYMLLPSYEFDSDIIPDSDFIYTDGMYNYRKFYSYQYNDWYYQHINWWWRPWHWGFWGWSYYWWWPWRWHHYYAWFWHSWWWNWYYWWYQPWQHNTSQTNYGETVTMCNVFKYNNYYPTEYIPIEPSKYLENKMIDSNEGNDKVFKDYVKYLTSTYKSNIYKINSYILDVNKMVDKVIAVCDYIIYDNDNTVVEGADINYNIVYDKYQRIDLNSNNKASGDSDLSIDGISLADIINHDMGILKANLPLSADQAELYNSVLNDLGLSAEKKVIKKAGDTLTEEEANAYNSLVNNGNNSNLDKELNSDDKKYETPISEYSIVNGIDITEQARPDFPIKPIYLLIAPKTQNNTNKIIKYKVNLYQYGNINTDNVVSFVMYQMPRLITVTYTFSCGGYNIRKDTFGILGNVNNVSPSSPANVNIITNTEFDEAEVRDYHMNDKLNDLIDKGRIVRDKTTHYNNLSTPYKYGIRRFYNGTSTIESCVNQDYDNNRNWETSKKAVNLWPTYEYGELPILALNDQDHIVVFLSTIAYDTGYDDFNNFFNSSVYVTFNLHTEDYNSNISVTMNGNKDRFKSNNIYGASNGNWNLHWGSNITGTDFKAYPDVKWSETYRNSNANIMYSHIYGYRLYLKHWFTSQQVSTQEIAVNGKRLKISFVWVNLPVVSTFWNSGDPNKT